jgi:homoserine dehydrogenase
MKNVTIVLIGMGNVGKAFIDLVQEKYSFCRSRYGLDLKFSAVFEIEGALFYETPVGAAEILKGQWNSRVTLSDVFDSHPPGVLVECVASTADTGEPGLSFIREALNHGWHVVTADKGPLVADFGGLRQKAWENNTILKISGAAAAALPTLDTALYSLAGTDIKKIEGILNGTSNYILTQMKKGIAYKEALEKAQQKGIAEPDPSLDVEGKDTAYKLFLITCTIFQKNIHFNEIKVEGITSLSPDKLRKGLEEGQTIKLLGKVKKKNGDLDLCVEPSVLNQNHPLYSVDGTNKGITFKTDSMDVVTVTGGKSDPKGAAAALLKDLINIYFK